MRLSASVSVLILWTTLSTSFSGCSLLVGNIKPVDEKSDEYHALDLAKTDPDWHPLPSSEIEESAPRDEAERARSENISDVSYQSKATASIISLNSACRPAREKDERSLQEITRLLFLGIAEVQDRTERQMQVDGQPALETTLEGKMNGERVRIRTVVTRVRDCVFDLMYVARPELFARQEPTFTRFVDTLKLGRH